MKNLLALLFISCLFLAGCAGETTLSIPIYSSPSYGSINAQIGITYVPPEDGTIRLPGDGKLVIPSR